MPSVSQPPSSSSSPRIRCGVAGVGSAYLGRLADQTGSFNEGIALAGLTPLIGLAALILLWREPERGRAEPGQGTG